MKTLIFFFINLFIFVCFGSLLQHMGFRRVGATLRCSARASHCSGFSCWGAQALGTWASVVVAHGLSSCGSQALECRLSSCGARAQLLRGMWDLPRPGIEPLSPALAGGFLSTAPPGKSLKTLLKTISLLPCTLPRNNQGEQFLPGSFLFSDNPCLCTFHGGQGLCGFAYLSMAPGI